MQLTPHNLELVQKSEHYQSLLQHPGFKELIDAAQSVVVTEWKHLLVAKPEEVPEIQGFIAGANFVLEYADAAVRDARRILADHREAQQRDFAAVEAARRQFESSRANGRSRVGADLG